MELFSVKLLLVLFSSFQFIDVEAPPAYWRSPTNYWKNHFSFNLENKCSLLNTNCPNGATEYLDRESFFVITTIFNPVSYQSRYGLYHQFVKHMTDAGAQLITIECIFPELGQETFKVTNAMNPLHIQLKSNSVYFIKENLINIAVNRLPSHAKWVAWVDADLQFEDNWLDVTIQKLKNYTVVQMFEICNFLGPDSSITRSDYSFGYSMVHNKIIDEKRYNEWYPHPGFAWATSVEAFKRMDGLLKYDILGSADLHFAFALVNKTTYIMDMPINQAYKDIYIAKSNQIFTELSKMNSNMDNGSVSVGYVPMNINHTWHGSRRDRQYNSKYSIIIAHNFNPMKDMRQAKNGLLEFVPQCEELEEDIVDYFRMRKEDETIVDETEIEFEAIGLKDDNPSEALDESVKDVSMISNYHRRKRTIGKYKDNYLGTISTPVSGY